MAADPGLHRSGFSVTLGRQEQQTGVRSQFGEDSPGNSAVRRRKLGRRSHNDVVVKLGERIPGRWSQCELVMKLACQLGLSTAQRRRASRHCGENR